MNPVRLHLHRVWARINSANTKKPHAHRPAMGSVVMWLLGVNYTVI